MVKYSYHRDPENPKRVLTIARSVVETHHPNLYGGYNSPTTSTVEVGFAICSPKDQFSKKMGRTIALGRLDKDPIQGPEGLGEYATRTRAIEILRYYVNDAIADGFEDEGYKLCARILNAEVTEPVAIDTETDFLPLPARRPPACLPGADSLEDMFALLGALGVFRKRV